LTANDSSEGRLIDIAGVGSKLADVFDDVTFDVLDSIPIDAFDDIVVAIFDGNVVDTVDVDSLTF
jgi:hypothetical protein